MLCFWANQTHFGTVQVRFDLFLMSCNSWLTVRLELLGGIMLVSAGSFAVAGRYVLEGGAAGNLLSYALQITGMCWLHMRKRRIGLVPLVCLCHGIYFDIGILVPVG